MPLKSFAFGLIAPTFVPLGDMAETPVIYLPGQIWKEIGSA